MISDVTGMVNEYVSVIGDTMFPAFIVKGAKKNLMIDAGVNLCGPAYKKSLEKILGDINKLDYLFVTHSHYDHLGAMPYLKRQIPGLKFGGDIKIRDLLKKESVIKRMNKLSEFQKAFYGDIAIDEDVRIDVVELDISLKEGDKIDLGGITCEVIETPGHTNDSISFFIPEQKILFAGEALGLPSVENPEKPHVLFLSSNDNYIKSIEKLESLKPEIIYFGHGFVVTGNDATDHFNFARNYTFQHIKLIENYLDSTGGDVEKAKDLMVKKEYDETGAIEQERNAYIANTTAQINHVYQMKNA